MLAAAPETLRARDRKRLFVVDDHPIFRKGIVSLILQSDDLELGGEAASAAEALDKLRGVKVDAISVDISLEGSNGIELIKSIRAEHPDVPIVVLSMHDESLYAFRALKAGAAGYVMKRRAGDEFLNAVRTALAGRIYFTSEFAHQIVEQAVRGGAPAGGPPVNALSDRELEILDLVGRGLGAREISEKLHVSVKTVESHRLHIKEKLGLKTAPELVRFAVDWVNQQNA